MKFNKKILSTILALSTISSLSGCSKKSSDENVIRTIVIDNTQEQNFQDSFSTNNNLDSNTVLDILNENLYDEYIDYNLIIKNYLNTDYNSRTELKDDYLRAIYMLLINSDVSMNIYLEELNNLIIMQQVPMELPQDVWIKLFGHLDTLKNDYQSLYEMFIDFAIYVHEIECIEKHNFNEYGSYTCNDLEEEYNLKLKLN